MTESEMIKFLTRSYDEFLKLNETYIVGPKKRKDRARLLADHKRWKAERESMIAEWRATPQPTATGERQPCP